jgi:hypothetical protein
MSIDQLPLDSLTPAALWAALDVETKALAARALYADKESRREADMAIAAALRFREVAVRKLPTEQRIKHVLKSLRPDDNLSSTLLLALHLAHRQDLLTVFLDAQGIPHDEGLIDGDYDLDPPDAERLRAPVDRLFSEFDAGEVELYLTTLLAVDPGSWGGVRELLEERRTGR